MTGHLMSARRQTVQLAPLDPLVMDKDRASTQVSPRAGVDPNRIMGGPPTLVFAGFEGGASLS